MKLRSLLPAVLVLTGIIGCAPDDPGIERASAERIIRTLAADSMRGRNAFSPDGMRAAAYIASEFEAIGLQPLSGSEGHLQQFPVYSVALDEISVTLNGSAVPAERIAAGIAADSIAWSAGNGPEATVVGADENLMQAFQRARQSGGDAFVVVPTAQQQTFDQMRRFMNRPSRTTDLGAGASLVVVLADIGSASDYTVQATASISETPLANVVGIIPGRRADEIVLFSGHYDHLGIRPAVEGDSIANGANDDASGTTAVIELARFFKSKGEPERTLMFAAFTAEESGGYGSRYFSEQLDPDRIVAMFNIEMIGKPGIHGPDSAWITGFERSSFGEILQRAVEGTQYEFYADPYPDQNLFYRSDNATLARLGVPAHSISTTPIDVDPDYHQVTDEVSTLDLDHMTNTIRAIAAGAETMVSGEETPTRVDPDTVD